MVRALLCALLLPRRAAAGCRSAVDCSLNGRCAPGGVCECLPQWHGAECGQLNLLPLPRSVSGRKDVNATTRKNISSWGGSVQLGADGVFHMWSAEMAGNCGIDSWLSNSVIAHVARRRTRSGTTSGRARLGRCLRTSPSWPGRPRASS